MAVRRRLRTEEDLDRAALMLEEGRSLREVGQVLGCSGELVRQRLVESGIYAGDRCYSAGPLVKAISRYCPTEESLRSFARRYAELSGETWETTLRRVYRWRRGDLSSLTLRDADLAACVLGLHLDLIWPELA
jgi:hypothetical protein